MEGDAQERWKAWLFHELSSADEHEQMEIATDSDHGEEELHPRNTRIAGILTSLLPMVLPSLIPLAVSEIAWPAAKQVALYTVQKSVQSLIQETAPGLGSSLVTSMFSVPSSLLSPHHAAASSHGWGSFLLSSVAYLPIKLLFTSSSNKPHGLEVVDQVIQQAETSSPSSFDTLLKGTTRGTIVLGVAAVATLIFEYSGMQAMRVETRRTPFVMGGLTARVRETIHERYRHKTQYYSNPNSKFSVTEIDPIRTVYNVLVGVNTILFTVVGGKSADPTAEIVHWTSILLYWEVLVRLVQLYGWSPVGAAVRLFFSRLVEKEGQKKATRPKEKR